MKEANPSPTSSWILGLTLVISSLISGTKLVAEPEFGPSFDRGYSFFKCAALAQWSKSFEEEQVDLFVQGVQILEPFTIAWFDEQLTDDDLEFVPNTVKRGLSHSYSPEFLMGFIWSAATNRTYLEIWDRLGKIEFSDVEEAWALQRDEAASQFKEKNCALLAG